MHCHTRSVQLQPKHSGFFFKLTQASSFFFWLMSMLPSAVWCLSHVACSLGSSESSKNEGPTETGNALPCGLGSLHRSWRTLQGSWATPDPYAVSRVLPKAGRRMRHCLHRHAGSVNPHNPGKEMNPGDVWFSQLKSSSQLGIHVYLS